jgi:GNAT superfamily N-acetyltransferase
MRFEIRQASSARSIARCYPVMRELRPHLEVEQLVLQVERQTREQGYRLVFLTQGGLVRAVAGYRILECLAWGRFLYVDDLVTCSGDQGRGYGSALFDWLVAMARRQGCAQFHLDSGVQRFGAHRFYLHKGMDITTHHFAMVLKA